LRLLRAELGGSAGSKRGLAGDAGAVALNKSTMEVLDWGIGNMEIEKSPAYKRALSDRIDRVCALLNRKDPKDQDEGYQRLMDLLEKYIVELQAED
jgi:hypothetical protein